LPSGSGTDPVPIRVRRTRTALIESRAPVRVPRALPRQPGGRTPGRAGRKRGASATFRAGSALRVACEKSETAAFPLPWGGWTC